MFNRPGAINGLSGLAKRAKNVALAIVVLSTALMPLAPTASAATAPGGRVSFTFDDGMQSAYTQAAPTLAKYGFTGTSYVTTGCVGMVTAPNDCRADDQVPYMSWAEVNALRSSYGWEIGSHTVTHPLLASTDPDDQPAALSETEVINELSQSKAAIQANTGVEPNAFATPYGDWTPATAALIAKYYTSHRGFADVGYNSFPYNDLLLYDQQVQAGNDDDVAPVSVATVKSYVDTAKANNQWLILTFHDIVASGAVDYAYNVSNLDAIAAYIKSQGVQVVNVSDGLAGGTSNLLSDSGFDNGVSSDIANTAVWSTDDPVNILADNDNNGAYPGSANSLVLNGTDKDIELFSPRVVIDPTQKYFVKSFLNVVELTVATRHEIAFFIDEYDGSGTFLSTQYKKSEPSVWIEYLNFEYIPTNANVKAARVQIVVTGDSEAKAYIDNVQMFVQGPAGGGSGSGKAGDVNGDNKVDLADATIVSLNWGKSGVPLSQGDLNGDNKVDLADATLISLNWGK